MKRICSVIVCLAMTLVAFAQPVADEKAQKQKALEFLQGNMDGLYSLKSSNVRQ